MTTHLVISDIHEDIESFKSLLEKYRKHFHDIWFLGDAAGHAEHLNGTASAIQCYQILFEYWGKQQLTCVAGNWEKWIWSSNSLALAAQWKNEIDDVRQKINDQELKNWIAGWRTLENKDGFTLTHGWIGKLLDQQNSELWETYVEERHTRYVGDAFLLDEIQTPHAIFGHTHNPGYFLCSDSQTKWVDLDPDLMDKEQKYERTGNRYAFNPGSLSGARGGKCKGMKTAILLNTDEKSFRFISL